MVSEVWLLPQTGVVSAMQVIKSSALTCRLFVPQGPAAELYVRLPVFTVSEKFSTSCVLFATSASVSAGFVVTTEKTWVNCVSAPGFIGFGQLKPLQDAIKLRTKRQAIFLACMEDDSRERKVIAPSED
ncbi:MAG TPA: hypothetical protein PKM44_04635, partial [Turneriella sp.]|nr:hypothetical protein [Turneriella sp.]